ncbi:MAG: PIN domain-containing protein [Firmicutes bacterium]|nr:PIN domain-containing protein [Bacillota bacterium]
MKVFVDTSAWYAIAVPEDQFHLLARDALIDLIKSGAEFFTTNLVVSETYTLILRRFGNRRALTYLDFIGRQEAEGITRIITVDRETEKEAQLLLQKYSDQSFSYVDAVSAVVALELSLEMIFSFDKHFAILGFARIP